MRTCSPSPTPNPPSAPPGKSLPDLSESAPLKEHSNLTRNFSKLFIQFQTEFHPFIYIPFVQLTTLLVIPRGTLLIPQMKYSFWIMTDFSVLTLFSWIPARNVLILIIYLHSLHFQPVHRKLKFRDNNEHILSKWRIHDDDYYPFKRELTRKKMNGTGTCNLIKSLGICVVHQLVLLYTVAGPNSKIN